jgi:hypothetical protein
MCSGEENDIWHLGGEGILVPVTSRSPLTCLRSNPIPTDKEKAELSDTQHPTSGSTGRKDAVFSEARTTYRICSRSEQWLVLERLQSQNGRLFLAVRVHMGLGRVLGVLCGVDMVSVRQVRMMGGCLVVPSFVMLGGFFVVASGVSVMLCRVLVMTGCFL